jgi:hypothetical protein
VAPLSLPTIRAEARHTTGGPAGLVAGAGTPAATELEGKSVIGLQHAAVEEALPIEHDPSVVGNQGQPG